jgi:hypothetical protein
MNLKNERKAKPSIPSFVSKTYDMLEVSYFAQLKK